MPPALPSILSAAERRASVLALGFGATVAMWAAGYVGRLPALVVPGPLLLASLLACLVAAGLALGRYAGLGAREGAAVGLLSGLLNLLVLGGLLGGARPGQGVPTAFVWLPGSILLAAVLAAAGAAAGARWARREPPYREWCAAFVRVAIAAALLLLVAGGLVTSSGAGLAVVDWPNTFGYNMFLYPFSRMTGGVYYEHAHRLFGALLGLTTLALAIQLQLREPRRWVRGVGWLALALVGVQGLLGGLRVTGRLTLSTDPAAMRPSIALALLHGILAQAVFAALVALGAFTSAAWRGPQPTGTPGTRRGRLLAAGLVAALVAQLVLGAAERHLGRLLLAHILFGVAVVAPLALHVGFRSWGLNPGIPLLQRLGLTLAGAAVLQVALGFLAFTVREMAASGGAAPGWSIATRTLHQGFGAALLGLAVLQLCWAFRNGGSGGGDCVY